MGINFNVRFGRLGKDAEIFGSEEKPIVVFSIATSEYIGTKDGKPQYTETEWTDVKCFGPAAKKAVRLQLRKGDNVVVFGTIITESWKSKDGSDRSKKVLKAFKYDDIVLELIPQQDNQY